MTVRYNAGDGIFEIILRDETGAKMMHFKANFKDTKRIREIIKFVVEKFGIESNSRDFFDY